MKLKARWRSCEISFLKKQALHLKTIRKENPLLQKHIKWLKQLKRRMLK